MAHTNVNPLIIEEAAFDLNPMLLACQNGVIDLRSGALRPGRQEDYISKASVYPWKGIDEPCPLWEKTLQEIFSKNEELIGFVRRLLGYSITGLTTERIIVIFQGQGSNGKSLITNVLTNLLSPLAGPIEAESLLDQGRSRSASGPSPDIMLLRGLRMALAAEADEGRRFSSSRVKWLTGSDILIGRHPHSKLSTRFKPTHTLFLLTNSKPHADPNDFAFWERLVFVPFPLSFVKRPAQAPNERPADLQLESKLKAEYSGILAWLIKGCLEWYRRGLDPPKIVTEAALKYQRDEDLLADFVLECLDIEPGARSLSRELYSRFSEWWVQNVGKRVPSKQLFGKWMGAKFEKSASGGYPVYLGCSIIP